MSRAEELSNMLATANNVPQALEITSIRKRVMRKAVVHYSLKTFRNVAILFIAILAGLIIGAKNNTAFAEDIKNIPIVGDIVDWILDNDIGVTEDIVREYGTVIENVYEDEYVSLNDLYVAADDNRIKLVGKVTLKGESKYISVVNIKDPNTNEEILSGYHDSFDDGFYEWSGEWDAYIPKVLVQWVVYDDSIDEHELDRFEMTLDVGNMYEGVKYEPDYKFKVDDYKFVVSDITINPLVTNVHIIMPDANYFYDDYDNFITEVKYIRCYLTDGTHTIYSDDEEFDWRIAYDEASNQVVCNISMASGYFALNRDNLSFGIDSIHAGSFENRVLYIDADTGELSDKDGKPLERECIVDDDQDFWMVYVGPSIIGRDDIYLPGDQLVYDKDNVDEAKYQKYQENEKTIGENNGYELIEDEGEYYYHDKSCDLYYDNLEVFNHYYQHDLDESLYIYINKALPVNDDGKIPLLRNYPTEIYNFGEFDKYKVNEIKLESTK